jgi:hypothetical protein
MPGQVRPRNRLRFSSARDRRPITASGDANVARHSRQRLRHTAAWKWPAGDSPGRSGRRTSSPAGSGPARSFLAVRVPATTLRRIVPAAPCKGPRPPEVCSATAATCLPHPLDVARTATVHLLRPRRGPFFLLPRDFGAISCFSLLPRHTRLEFSKPAHNTCQGKQFDPGPAT